MPQGKGTYGKKRGRPPVKGKKGGKKGGKKMAAKRVKKSKRSYA
tara:strand:+ start:2956 stop:3087 length:132 start_codon:yes stop_codon:yes gene_type:complete